MPKDVHLDRAQDSPAMMEDQIQASEVCSFSNGSQCTQPSFFSYSHSEAKSLETLIIRNACSLACDIPIG